MLSILIPTKDYNCRILVEALSRQGELLAVPYEILLGEDGSSCEGVELNRPLSGLPGCRIIEYKENQGRARIRNIACCGIAMTCWSSDSYALWSASSPKIFLTKRQAASSRSVLSSEHSAFSST